MPPIGTLDDNRSAERMTALLSLLWISMTLSMMLSMGL